MSSKKETNRGFGSILFTIVFIAVSIVVAILMPDYYETSTGVIDLSVNHDLVIFIKDADQPIVLEAQDNTFFRFFQEKGSVIYSVQEVAPFAYGDEYRHYATAVLDTEAGGLVVDEGFEVQLSLTSQDPDFGVVIKPTGGKITTTIITAILICLIFIVFIVSLMIVA